MEKKIVIDGMMCKHCAGRVEKALNEIDGVSARIELEKKTAYVSCIDTVSEKTLSEAVEKAGYKVVSIG